MTNLFLLDLLSMDDIASLKQSIIDRTTKRKKNHLNLNGKLHAFNTFMCGHLNPFLKR